MVYMKTHIVIGTAQLLDGESSYPRVDSTGPEKLKCIINVNFSPYWKQFFYRLFYFKRVSPSDSFEKFSKAAFIAG